MRKKPDNAGLDTRLLKRGSSSASVAESILAGRAAAAAEEDRARQRPSTAPEPAAETEKERKKREKKEAAEAKKKAKEEEKAAKKKAKEEEKAAKKGLPPPPAPAAEQAQQDVEVHGLLNPLEEKQLRAELAKVKLEELKKRARVLRIEESAIGAAIDKADPEDEMIQLILAVSGVIPESQAGTVEQFAKENRLRSEVTALRYLARAGWDVAEARKTLEDTRGMERAVAGEAALLRAWEKMEKVLKEHVGAGAIKSTTKHKRRRTKNKRRTKKRRRTKNKKRTQNKRRRINSKTQTSRRK